MIRVFHSWYDLPEDEREQIELLDYLGNRGWQVVHMETARVLMVKGYSK